MKGTATVLFHCQFNTPTSYCLLHRPFDCLFCSTFIQVLDHIHSMYVVKDYLS